MFLNKIFTYLRVRTSKSKRCFNVKSSTYFHTKTKILADFQIGISVPLRNVLCLLIPAKPCYIIFLYSERYGKSTACSSSSSLCSDIISVLLWHIQVALSWSKITEKNQSYGNVVLKASHLHFGVKVSFYKRRESQH